MMSISDAVVTALLGYGVVFAGVAALMLVITIFGKIMAARENGGAKK